MSQISAMPASEKLRRVSINFSSRFITMRSMMSPKSLADILRVKVSDLPDTNLVSNSDTGKFDILRFGTKGNSMVTDQLGELDLEKENNCLAISDLNTAVDNYHKTLNRFLCH